MAISLESGPFGSYIIENEDGRTVLVQTDWDFPGVASTFGWAPCHGSTDGTIDCPECGKTASVLISEAAAYLDDHLGDVAEDPGYFEEGA